MIITYYGLSCFKVEAHGIAFAINPFSKTTGLSAPRFEAAAVLASSARYNTSNISGDPRLISGPGEYDICEIIIQGIMVAKNHTAYVIKWNGLRLLHLGEFTAAKETDAEKALKEIVGEIDILLLPVGDALGPAGATTVMNMVEPRIIIPMQYALKGAAQKLGALADFTKMASLKPREEERLSIKRKDLPTGGTNIVVLQTSYGIL